jgi:hypothetical protein
MPVLHLVRMTLYVFTLLFSIVLFALTIARLSYTDHKRDPLVDPLRNGVAFYGTSYLSLLLNAV